MNEKPTCDFSCTVMIMILNVPFQSTVFANEM